MSEQGPGAPFAAQTADDGTIRASARVRPLAVGTVLSGAAAYLVIALGTRAVGEALFAPVSVLWSLWALSAAAISFPVQHWFIRSAETNGEAAVWARMSSIVVGVAVLSVVVGVGSAILGTALYPTSPQAFSIMTGLVPAGSLLVGLQRGVLAHRGRFGGVAVVLAGENIIRAGVTLVVLLLGSGTQGDATTIGWGIIGGFAIAVAYLGVLVPHHDGATNGSPSLRLLGGFAGANVAAQTALTSGPVLLALLRAPEATITQVFAILALLRVPYTGLVGASAAVTGPLTRMASTGDARQLRRLELVVILTALGTALVAVAAAPAILPPVVALLFAATITISDVALSALAAGGALAIVSLFEMLLLLALHRPRRLLGAWVLGLTAGAGCLALPVDDPVTRVAIAFLVAEAGALIVMAGHRRGRSGVVEPMP